jgi:2'-5' RNA ligase
MLSPEQFPSDPNRDEHTSGSMLSLDLPHGVIPRSPGGVDGHHITLIYLGKNVPEKRLDEISARAKQVAASTPALRGVVSGRGKFEPSDSSDGRTPVYARPLIKGITQLQKQFADLSESEHGFHPHITLKYLDEGDEMPKPVPPTDVAFSHLSLHRGDKVERFPFRGVK